MSAEADVGSDSVAHVVPWHDRETKPRSLSLDVFGDYVRLTGNEVSLLALVEFLECFDVAEAATRMMMSRDLPDR